MDFFKYLKDAATSMWLPKCKKEVEKNDERLIIIAKSVPAKGRNLKGGSKTFLILREHVKPRVLSSATVEQPAAVGRNSNAVQVPNRRGQGQKERSILKKRSTTTAVDSKVKTKSGTVVKSKNKSRRIDCPKHSGRLENKQNCCDSK